MDLTILQTSDAFKYSRMLRATSRTAIEYARRHGFVYESFTGIKRGFRGAHAAFNRIMLLDEMIARGNRGWALYMDADAYVYDLDFDLHTYLADKQDRSAVMATIPGEMVPWHINSGVLLFNLGHPAGRSLIGEWKRRFMAIAEDSLRSLETVWDDENDQILLYKALNEDPVLRDAVLFEDAKLFNHHDARFIRQFLNSLDGNIDTRTETIEVAVNEVLHGQGMHAGSSAEQQMVADLYRIILGRDPDSGSRGYSDLIAAQGLTRGTPIVVSALLDSEEYRLKRR
ncbi:hypothetical protein [Sphingomonas sp. SRS2]|uniref:hypothetical protein n=1 Tax=Sphingomonas sp. SRS2 TaxID=133190 RepID=UPI0006184DC3|nr:hypothetical protein [Sphingomonas sp. SRS2]KKC26957.1 hypothetical protein WP12_05650 [Sphingomonas sp. SRS2]